MFGECKLSIMVPSTMSPIAVNEMKSRRWSCKTQAMPEIKTIPTPHQTAYATPMGMIRSAIERQ